VPAQSGDLYFTVDTYYQGTIPWICTFFYQPQVTYTVKKNGNILKTMTYEEQWIEPYLVAESTYAAGDAFTMEIDYYWDTFYAKDYTIKVYSKQTLSVKDSKGNTNMIHMDGKEPSGFTKSKYRS
jgi:hypothetical protein